MQTFGKNLKQIRESNGLSQRKLAHLMDIPQQRVSEWECGKIEPTLQTLMRLIKVLDTTFEELTEGINN